MRIEDYWYDGVLCEMEFRSSQVDYSQYLFCFVYNDIIEVQNENVKNSKYITDKEISDNEFYEKEIYEVLIEKELLDNKVYNNDFLHSVYRVIFIGKPRKKKLKIEKILVLNSHNTEKRVRVLVKERFKNVIEVVSVYYESSVII